MDEKEKFSLKDHYKLKGAQQISLQEYLAMREKGVKKKFKIRLPPQLQFIIGTPFFIIFCCGLIFIPFMLYLILTSPSAPPPTDEPQTDITGSVSP